MNKRRLMETARAMVAKGKGILAADESPNTIKKRFDAIGVASTETNRRDYRELLFRTSEAMRANIAGVILYDETIRQKAIDGTPLLDIITEAGSIPGMKVDLGTKPLSGCPGEVITEGLDGLGERLKEYRKLGVRFTKWRGVIDIGVGIPTRAAIATNSQALARYAAISQAHDLVPIVEPEVLMDGGHPIERCAEVTREVLKTVFDDLSEQGVLLEGIVLKPNMVISGKKAGTRAALDEVAEQTVGVLKNCVPPAVAGIAFLSGGQLDDEATLHLNLVNQMGLLPWPVTFSFGRALQQEAQRVWGGRQENVPAAQRAFAHRAYVNGLAAKGEYLGLNALGAIFEGT